MKKLLSILALFLLSLFALSACKVFEKNVSLGNGLELVATSDERSYAVSNYKGISNIVTIPSNYNIFAVTSISNGAFKDCTNLLRVTIPNSISSIAGDAFEGCYYLIYNEYDNAYYLGNAENPYVALIKAKNKSISSCKIHENTKIIADDAFYGCKNLTSVTIPDSVTSIGSAAFNGCDSLTSVTIPDSVTSIGSSAFSGCDNLTSVTIGDSVTSIEYGAFRYCDNLTSVTIGNSVTSIGDYAFEDCDSLTSVTIPDSVTSIGWGAFYRCSNLTSVITKYPGTIFFANNRYETFERHGVFENCDRLVGVFYTGDFYYVVLTQIFGTIEYDGVTSYYLYSETEPTVSGNFWHYDNDGNIAIWGAE